jgi:hypothetical protein
VSFSSDASFFEAWTSIQNISFNANWTCLAASVLVTVPNVPLETLAAGGEKLVLFSR